jgi:hypothetical protein
MDATGWGLFGGYILCGLAVATVVYHLHFARQAPEDGGVVLLMIPIWPAVIAGYLLFGLAALAMTVVTFGENWRRGYASKPAPHTTKLPRLPKGPAPGSPG